MRERGNMGPEEQLLAATRRQEAVIPMAKEFRPQAAVSLASEVCAKVAYGLRCPARRSDGLTRAWL